MKQVRFLMLVGLIGIFASSNLVAQKGKYGEDSVACVTNLSLMTTSYQMKNYDDCLKPWRYVFFNCPTASKNIYIRGAVVLKYQIKKYNKAKNTEAADAYLDTLMMLYDQRIQYYPKDKGRVLGSKGIDLFAEKSKDMAQVEIAHNWMKESIDIQKTRSSTTVVQYFLVTSLDLKTAGKKTPAQAFEDYVTAYELLEKIKKNPKEKEDAEKALENINALISSKEHKDLFDCATLIPFYTPRVNDEMEVDKAKQILQFLFNGECTNDPLYEKVLTIIVTKEPEAKYLRLAYIHYKTKGELNQALTMIKKALELETDPEDIAKDNYKIAELYMAQGRYSESRAACYTALKTKPNWGDPYILIGDLYQLSYKTCFEEEFEKRCIYWAAVDMYAKAKSVDPEAAASANAKIASCASKFPTTQEMFFRTINEGDSYTVECWINATTTARARK